MLMSYELLALLVSLDTVRMLLQEPKSRVKMNVPPRTLPENWIFRHMYKYHMPTLPGEDGGGYSSQPNIVDSVPQSNIT
ncbi:hypothetical protein V6N12_073135 [Hibiscus sabdariffa]|uniref:Uncharacterized protein n=1 Tax=Hibiscus sabdariffa TaxID=183260 RepID=A0ABR2B7E3_9ROSI